MQNYFQNKIKDKRFLFIFTILLFLVISTLYIYIKAHLNEKGDVVLSGAQILTKDDYHEYIDYDKHIQINFPVTINMKTLCVLDKNHLYTLSDEFISLKEFSDKGNIYLSPSKFIVVTKNTLDKGKTIVNCQSIDNSIDYIKDGVNAGIITKPEYIKYSIININKESDLSKIVKNNTGNCKLIGKALISQSTLSYNIKISTTSACSNYAFIYSAKYNEVLVSYNNSLPLSFTNRLGKAQSIGISFI